jgi:hypothetical protein
MCVLYDNGKWENALRIIIISLTDGILKNYGVDGKTNNQFVCGSEKARNHWSVL